MAEPTAATRVRPSIAKISLENYRAFEQVRDFKLGRITIILGRNNAGKSALCFAPFYFAQAFRANAVAPLISGAHDLGFGSPQSAIYRKSPNGMKVEFELTTGGNLEAVELGVTVVPENNFSQQITSLRIRESGVWTTDRGLERWETVSADILAHSELPALANEVGGLQGVRPLPERDHEQIGHAPQTVGIRGDDAAAMLFVAGDAGLDKVNEWFARIHAKLIIQRHRERFEILAIGSAGEPVNLVASGAGIAQILPLVVQLLLAKGQPRLWCVEQPELHLHPAAHAHVAELFIDRLKDSPESQFLIETHSDALVLRMRREVASGRLSPEDLRIYFVDEGGPELGSSVKEIELTEDGTPRWWPKGVFAEPENEYFKIRRAALKRQSESA